jgi:hypothetical protein
MSSVKSGRPCHAPDGRAAGRTLRTSFWDTLKLTLTEQSQATVVKLDISITAIGPKAKMAAFGMNWGYKQ